MSTFWEKYAEKIEASNAKKGIRHGKVCTPDPGALTPDMGKKLLVMSIVQIVQFSFPSDFKDLKRLNELVQHAEAAAGVTLSAMFDNLKPLCKCSACEEERKKK